jgi:L-aspartate oxidase
MPGLWAAGEVACNGVMGANRLASNSLLDGMVFAPRAVDAIDDGRDGPSRTGAMRAVLADPANGVIGGRSIDFTPAFDAAGPPVDRATLQAAMTEHAGVLRSARSLETADDVARRPAVGGGIEHAELRNLQVVAQALCAAAEFREETRGAHARVEFPARDDRFAMRLVLATS